ncbi:MAG: DJ-1/PfpI family protein [Spirochaetes bacterium]|nr:DJ-1/PfpI family protein [Spirochaetota bacterium]
MSKKVVLFLAEGFEEVEAVTPIDYLRRAGFEVAVCAVGDSQSVKGARGITLKADTTLEALGSRGADFWDAAVVPGGMPGAANIAASKEAGALLVEMAAAGKTVAAICAAPALVLFPLGLLNGKNFTCYPGMEKNLSGANWLGQPVVVDGGIITSRGAGTAGLFSVSIIEQLAGAEAAEKIAAAVLL